MTAKEKALKLLEKRDYSRTELIRKLTEKGFEETEAAEAVESLVSLGFVDDARYAPIVVRHYSKKGYGAGRIKAELSRRGVPKELWEDALEEISDSGDTLDAIISQKLGGRDPDRKELKKLTDMLLRRGFSWGDIKTALGRYDENLEETD